MTAAIAAYSRLCVDIDRIRQDNEQRTDVVRKGGLIIWTGSAHSTNLSPSSVCLLTIACLLRLGACLPLNYCSWPIGTKSIPAMQGILRRRCAENGRQRPRQSALTLATPPRPACSPSAWRCHTPGENLAAHTAAGACRLQPGRPKHGRHSRHCCRYELSAERQAELRAQLGALVSAKRLHAQLDQEAEQRVTTKPLTGAPQA